MTTYMPHQVVGIAQSNLLALRGKFVTQGSTRRQYRQEWKIRSLGGGELLDTHAFILESAYTRFVELAGVRKERLPAFVGRLAMLALEVVDGGSAVDTLEKLKRPVGANVTDNDPQSPTLAGTVVNAVLASRFSNETMSARFRQATLIKIIADETARGNTVTANTVAAIAGGDASQIRVLARLLTKRGVLSMQGCAGLGSGTYAKVLGIRHDAVERFTKVHLEETGSPLTWAP